MRPAAAALLVAACGSGCSSGRAPATDFGAAEPVAPAAADATMFLDADGKPLPHAQAARGGRAVAAPGALKMLEAAHRMRVAPAGPRHGAVSGPRARARLRSPAPGRGR